MNERTYSPLAVALAALIAPSLDEILVAAIVDAKLVSIDYTDSEGVRSQRNILPDGIKRCQNGNTIVKAYDPQRKDRRSFSLASIHSVGLPR